MRSDIPIEQAGSSRKALALSMNSFNILVFLLAQLLHVCIRCAITGVRSMCNLG